MKAADPQKDKFPQLPQLEKQITDTRQRNLTGSLEQCKEELRDAYMNFKDLQQRCVVDMKETNPDSGVEEHRVFYFKPETFLLDEAEKQRNYRDHLLKKVGQLPKPDNIAYLGDELHRSMSQSIADRSHPVQSKKMLKEFYKRRQYNLQHMKYKLLCRWAHHTLTSEIMEKIGPEATFMYGKLEFNLENAISRHDRLNQPDYFDSLKPEQRPSTKADLGGGALYVENFNIAAQSLIREDDIEVFTRATTYRNKVSKVVNKLMSRLKWLPLLKKYQVFEKSIEEFFKMKDANIGRQRDMIEKVRNRTKQNFVMTADLNNELKEVIEGYHYTNYQKTFLTNIEKIAHSWKATHDEVPKLMTDCQLLKIKTLESAAQYNLTGDVELDQGYSFSYQITVFFPVYFQRQVIKSQFSIYDAFGEDIDTNEIQKITLNQMAHIDTNIFRDVSTQKASVPTDESIKLEFRQIDIKIMRLKSAAYWLNYVALTPSEPDWHQKQQALLSIDNPNDKLLVSAMTFLDIQDLATINRILEDSANLHQETVQKLKKEDPHNGMKKVNIQTVDGDKHMNVDMMPQMKASSRAANIEGHLIPAVQQDYLSTDGKSCSTSGRSQHAAKESAKHEERSGPTIRMLPTHLLSAYFTLRFIASRDAKTKILYTLNYFRSIQKRLTLDLREFATRDRIDGSVANPFVQSQEASNMIVNQVNLQTKAHENRLLHQNKGSSKDSPRGYAPKMSVFDKDAIAAQRDMASVRFYKCNGMFSNKVFNTCPSFPKFHVAHGEPLVHQGLEEESDKHQTMGVSEQAVKLMNRIDFIELNEQLEEVYVKDDFSIYVMYDCALQDMKCLEDELLKVGSYFVKKSEVLLDPSQKPIPSRDRQELLQDLLTKEATFQFQKVKLVQAYMECYEHVADPLEQQRLMQIVTDIMARRPRLNLHANYFVDAYDAEIMCLKKQFSVVKQLIDLQITLEKTENKRLQDQLNLSYDLANQYSKNKWKYQDAESLLQAIEKTRKEKKEKEEFNRQLNQEVEAEIANANKQESSKSMSHRGGSQRGGQISSSSYKGDSEVATDFNEKSGLNDGLTSENRSMNSDDVFDEDQNQFTALLGLPQISIESIYQSYREKDTNVLQLMKEHNNFITCYEGYPEFLTMLCQNKSILEKNKVFKANSWSQETGALDFYDSLEFINKYHSITQQVQQELYDGLKVWDTTLMSFIDMQVCDLVLEEFHQVQQYQDGTLVEYQGRELVEDESITGNADKLIFFAKEMISQLTCQPKHLLDPFIIAKLDVQSAYYFKFPQKSKETNKYVQRKKGVFGHDYIIQQDKEAITRIAKEKIGEPVDEKIEGFLGVKISNSINQRNLQAPCMLQTYCNMAEFLRLRQEIIMAVSETTMLTQIYQRQCDLIGEKSRKVEYENGILWHDNYNGEDKEEINYCEDGPAHLDQIHLAVREFDPALLSNFNFRNPDSFKINILTSGLEEVRAILHYQILQKHLLIVATRINSLVIDTYERAMSELSLIETTKYCIPNSIVNYSKIMNRGNDGVNLNSIRTQKKQYKMNMSSACKPVFQIVQQKKNQSRSQLTKEFSQYEAQTVAAIPHANTHVIGRVMRCFRVKMLNRFVQSTLQEVYLDAQKIQALQACQRLRHFNRFFMFDPKAMGVQGVEGSLFKYETSQLLENFPQNYLPDEFKEDEDRVLTKVQEDFKCLRGTEIIDFEGIPSSMTLLTLDALPVEDTRQFKQKRQVIKEKRWPEHQDKEDLGLQPPELLEPEQHLKRLLPTFTPDESLDQLHGGFKTADELKTHVQEKVGKSAGGVLDYEEGLYFGDSRYAALTRYYVSLERILSIEWFMRKLQFRADEVVHFDHAIESGLPFFNQDEFDLRASQQLKKIPRSQKNRLTQDFLFDQVLSVRQKRDIAEGVQSLARVMKNFIKQYKKTREDNRFEYLTQYTEFRYQQVVGSLHKLVQRFYEKENLKAVKSIQSGIAQLTKMDHIKMIHMRPNMFTVNSSAVSPMLTPIDAQNLIHGACQHDDMTTFYKSIQPILNEKTLEPSQITLFESLYQQDLYRKSLQTQFAGQLCSTSNSVSFKPMETILLSLDYEDRQYAQQFMVMTKYQASDFMESVYDDSTLADNKEDDVYNLHQLRDGKKFINESATALLLKNALICWFENSTLPESAKVFKKFQDNFRQNYFWKQLEHKEEIARKLHSNNALGAQAPTEKDLKELKDKIDNLVNNQSLATTEAVAQRDQMVRALREEFAALKKKVTLDNYYNMRAEISVFSNEIEKLLINAAIKCLDSESAALTKCFAIQVPLIQYHIHPFQTFAATFYDKVDPNANLDICNKVSQVQEMLTKMRNRSTEVETLTSGPGIVITIKDLNEILIDFSRSSVQDQQQQYKSRNELTQIMEAHYRQMIFVKDQKISNMERRIQNIGQNLDSIISSRLFEKGNQLIYELDNSNRILDIFKKSMNMLETKLTEKVLGEQLQKFKRKNNQVEMKDQKFNDYKETILNMIGADFAEEQTRIKQILKEKANRAKITDDETLKKTPLYPATGTNVYTKNDKGDKIHQSPQASGFGNGMLPGAVVPDGFTHYAHCICYVPDPKFPRPTMELAELDMLSEQEARNELARMCTLVRKQRLLYRTKEMCMMTKYQNKINLLEQQQNNNQLLWEQLAEADKRERVLKQELVATQSSLANAEKTIENQNYEIKNIDADRCRLLKFKASKVDRMKDLEDKVRRIDVFENIDGDKLVAALTKKDTQVKQLITSQEAVDVHLLEVQHRKDKETQKFKKALFQEQLKTSQIVEKMDQLKLELKMLEQNDSSVTSIWKKKCLDLFEVCQSIKVENEELRGRCQELIEQGLTLANQITQGQSINQGGVENNLSISQDTGSQGTFNNSGMMRAVTTHISKKLSTTQSSIQQASKPLGSAGVTGTVLPELTHNASFTQKPNSAMLESTRNMTPHTVVQTSQDITTPVYRNQRYTSTYQSLSKDIHSEETNVPTEGVLHSARWAMKQTTTSDVAVSPMNLPHRNTQRGKSMGAMALAFKSQRSNDIRSIIEGDQPAPLKESTPNTRFPSEMSSQKKPNNKSTTASNALAQRKNYQFQQAVQRKNQLHSLHQDSLFHPTTSMTSSQQQRNKAELQAVQQLKGANRFAKQSFDLKGKGFNQSKVSENGPSNVQHQNTSPFQPGQSQSDVKQLLTQQNNPLQTFSDSEKEAMFASSPPLLKQQMDDMASMQALDVNIQKMSQESDLKIENQSPSTVMDDFR